jgi:hypothetical protein
MLPPAFYIEMGFIAINGPGCFLYLNMIYQHTTITYYLLISSQLLPHQERVPHCLGPHDGTIQF